MLFFGNDLGVCVDRKGDGKALQEKPLRTKKDNGKLRFHNPFLIKSTEK